MSEENIFSCNHCKKIPDYLKADYCGAPACMGWHIERNPKPIPDRSHDYDFWHDEFDGADGGNGLCGTAPSYQDAENQIIEIMNNYNQQKN